MENMTIDLSRPPISRLFLNVSEEEILFYRRFVQRHGGAFEPMEQPVDRSRLQFAPGIPADQLDLSGSYRLDFPRGARIAANEGFDLRDSYRVLYPDGAYVVWYRVLTIDRRRVCDVLLV